jgi:hypothetical protein
MLHPGLVLGYSVCMILFCILVIDFLSPESPVLQFETHLRRTKPQARTGSSVQLTGVIIDSAKKNTTSTQSGRKLMYFLHIHKSGGSTMCTWAKRNRHRVPPYNCAIDTGKPCCGGESKEAQREFAETSEYTFIENENFMFSDMNLDFYHYVTTLRNPFERYVSHYEHIYRIKKNIDTFDNWMKGQPDNWITRHVCGTPCSQVAKYGLTLQHFMRAYTHLQNFSDILFLETWKDSSSIFAKRHGWSNGQRIHSNKAPFLHAHDHRVYRNMTVLDDALYNYAFRRFSDSILQVRRNVSGIVSRLHDIHPKFLLSCGQKCSLY